MKKLLKLGLLLLIPSFAFVACNNKDNTSSNVNTVGGVGGYYMANGYCYARNGQVVQSQFCNQNMTGGFYTANGYCYSNSGQVVNSAYCTNNGGMMGGTAQCMGTYYYPQNGSLQQVYCNGNCSGYMLYNQLGQAVQCM